MQKLKRFFKYLLLTVISIFIIVSLYILIKGYSMYKDALNNEPLLETISNIQSQENFVTIDKVPDIFKNAIIAVEDKRFYSHSGVDILSIGRAVKTNFIDGKLSEGGSTITQQIAKNLYFTQKKHFTRKVAEIFMAWEIEEHYSKNEILEIYININFYGSGYYGIYDASQGYYEKEPIELSDYEATLLAGVPNAPSVYSPKVNLNLAEQRQNIVLEKMIDAGYLNEDEANEIKKEQITQ